ncbi:ribosomal maturation YjgA family protein [Anaerosacchariphilus polymeriproducens]|uniref:DUF2809 domain-containing protein n=1 Tax=Anaerosacchariphilus polymeriproducens TaxID=1812858 RepID=A0A371B058_9FIRM|nr:DUF2809 domain-containing protein [Anaerosacchariphilus polymeriproducens]RDU25215.1 DUF2809 domain-containing protein [Anaerosacchariphilus polymeriproducens]
MTLQNKEKRKQRISYAIAFSTLFIIEILIAIFVHDTFIRPYIGDVLVVVVLYMGVRIFIPNGCRLLAVYIFLFATLVEYLQYFKLIQLLGMENNTFLRVIIGSVFDEKDILCYGVGCILLGIYEWIKISLGQKSRKE